jgi:diguanylate cyclase (GGDEF)-like protein/PAS domain S-box-containing protein
LSARDDELERLRAEVAYLRAVVNCAGDIIVTTDREGRIIEWSEGARKALGWERDEMIGRPASSVYVDPGAREALVERLRAQGGAPLVDQEIAVRRKDGKKLWLSLSLAELRGPSGEPIGTVGVAKDVTERRRLERELRRLSVTDKLTGLFNQSQFFESLEVEKERAARLGHALSLVLFDLDRFKEWNDSRGHDEGDRALRAVGSVIFGAIRKEVDTGYRYGGDEFCVLLPGTEPEGAVVFAERIRAGVERLGIGTITASFGVSSYDPRRPARKIVKEADAAMYRAKRAGGNRICIYGRAGVAWAGGRALPCKVDADVAESV